MAKMKAVELDDEALDNVIGGIQGFYGGVTFVDETEPDAGNDNGSLLMKMKPATTKESVDPLMMNKQAWP